jgi:hypothetical protein
MSSRTIFLSRLIGLYCILAALAMIAHGRLTVETVSAILHDAPMMLVLGVCTLAAGLAMILAHNIWKGGALSVLVTIVGWLTAIKGLAFMVLPTDALANFYLTDLHYSQFFYVYMGFLLLIGLWVTYGGFTAKADS